MSAMLDLRCDPDDASGLRREIERRNRIIEALARQVEHNLNATDTDYALLQNTIVLQEEVRARQQIEGQVRQLLEHQQLIFNNAHVGIVLLSHRVIMECNSRMAEMFGYASPQDLIGKSTEILFESREAYEKGGELFYGALRRIGSIQSEIELVRHDGKKVWMMLTGRPIDRRDVMKASIWVYTDVTEQHHQAAQLMLADRIFAHSMEALMITDAQGVIQNVNLAFCRITGYAREEILGKTPAMMKSGRHDPAFYTAMWQSVLTTGAWEGEVWDRRKNGEIFPKWLSITVVKDDNGKPQHFIGCFSDISARKAAEERIHHMAHHDPLTGLPNRLLLRERFNHMLELQRRYGQRLGFVFLDLDHFKRVNDSLGHPVGDGLLMAVVGRLRQCLRDSDTLSRLGGDEFVILLGRLEDAADASRVAEKLLRALADPFIVGDHVLNVSASLGISIAPEDGSDFDGLMQRADTAMYHAKDAGRCRFSFYSREMNVIAHRRLDISNRLRRALDGGEFSLVYQPQVYADSRQVFGAEALLRWHTADGAVISPVEFIPIAEESGLILPIGEFAIAEACRQSRLWQDAGHAWRIAVNVSAAQLFRADIVETLLRHSRHAGIDPRMIEVELTESTLVEDTATLTGIINDLKRIGTTIAIDDFGTGYSSLSYLKRFRVDKLKIDRAFVSDLGSSPAAEGSALSQLIINIARTLHMRVIAEGVETAAQLEQIRRQGCNEIQGYHFSRPLAAADFPAFAARADSNAKLPA